MLCDKWWEVNILSKYWTCDFTYTLISCPLFKLNIGALSHHLQWDASWPYSILRQKVQYGSLNISRLTGNSFKSRKRCVSCRVCDRVITLILEILKIDNKTMFINKYIYLLCVDHLQGTIKQNILCLWKINVYNALVGIAFSTD